MSLLVGTLAVLAAVVWVFTLVDLIRQHYPGWTTFGWLMLILLLPFLGSLIYWIVRKPTADDVERARMADADMRRSAAARPFDSTRT
jgi:hypothetical protein